MSVAERDDETYAVQVKHYSIENSVGSSTIQKASGLLARSDIDGSIVVTTSSFTSEARAVARNRGVDLQVVNPLAKETEHFPDLGDSSRDDMISKESGSPDAAGNNITADFLGAESIKADAGSNFTLANEKLDGIGLALELNPDDVDDHVWFSIDDTSDVKIVSESNEVYTPLQVSEKPIASSWQTHDPSARTQVGARNLNIDIQIYENCNYFIVVNVPSLNSLESFQIDRYDLKLNLRDLDIESSDLPADLLNSLRSAEDVCICK